MNQSTYRISLDIHSVASQLSFSINRGDNMRRLIITLTENGKTYEITDDCYAIFTTVKPDGTHIANDCTIKDNAIIYDFTEQTTVVAGKLDCSVIIYNSKKEILTSPRFTVIVYETTHQNIDVESASEYTTLVEKISEADAKIEEMDGFIKSVEKDRDNGVYDGSRIYTAYEGYTDLNGVEKILLHKIQNFDENIRVNDYVLYSNGVLYRIIDIPDDISAVVLPCGSFKGEKGEQGQEGESIYSVKDNAVISENPNKDEEYSINTSIVAIWGEDSPVNVGDTVVDGLGNVYIISRVSPAGGMYAKVYWTGSNIKGKDGEGIPDGGTAGQFLKKTESGTAWQDFLPNVTQNANKTIIVDGSIVNGNWTATFAARQGGQQRPICTQYTNHYGAKAEMVATANSAKFKFVSGSTDPQSYMEIFEDKINFSKPITVQGNPVGGSGGGDYYITAQVVNLFEYYAYPTHYIALPTNVSKIVLEKVVYLYTPNNSTPYLDTITFNATLNNYDYVEIPYTNGVVDESFNFLYDETINVSFQYVDGIFSAITSSDIGNRLIKTSYFVFKITP
jgi:hypothetical protein